MRQLIVGGIFILLGLLIVPVHSTTYYVWAFGNDSSNTGLNWGDAFATLQKAVAEAQSGDTILIGYDASEGTEYEVLSAIVVNKPLTISSARFGVDNHYDTAIPDSARCILNAHLANRILSISAAVEIRGIGFKKGNASVGSSYYFGYGGALLIEGTDASGTLIHHCWFDSNYAAYNLATGYGGAIACYNTGKNLIIRNNHFTHNVASTKINYSGEGGALYFYQSTAIVEGNSFQGNIAAINDEGKGGALYAEEVDSSLTIQHNVFTNNVASVNHKGIGGAIYLNVFGQVLNNRFEENIASQASVDDYQIYGLGGAIYAYQGTAALRIENNIIRNNKGATNTVGGHGGGIYLWQCEGTIVQNNQIIDNIASSGSKSGTGGGISSEGWGSYVFILQNTIAGNIAATTTGEGGGLYVLNAHIEGNTISDNTAAAEGDDGKGGGIYNDGNSTITNNTFYKNIALKASSGSGYGGAIYSWSNEAAKITYNTFNNNSASSGDYGRGGALFLRDTTQVMYNIFKYNRANRNASGYIADGDAIYIEDFSGERWRIHNNVFFQNLQAIYSNLNSIVTGEQIVNNIFYDLSNTSREAIIAQQAITIYNNCFYGYANKYNWIVSASNNIVADPRVDTTSFSLQFDSPCIDAGYGSYSYNETENHQKGWKPDIGVHEYTGTQVRQYLTPDHIGKTIYFGGEVRAKVTLHSATISNDAYIDITVHPGNPHTSATSGVKRYFTIQTQGISNYNAELTLSYRDSELNGNSEGTLYLIHYNTQKQWIGPYRAAADTSDNWIATGTVTQLEGEWFFTPDTTLVGIPATTDGLPTVFRLYPAYPNPFNPSTTISFDLPQRSFVTIDIYNALGQRVQTLLQKELAPGHHQVHWQGHNQAGEALPSGMYYLHLKTDKFRATQRLLLLK